MLILLRTLTLSGNDRHHDHRRAAARNIDPLGLAQQGDLALVEIIERVAARARVGNLYVNRSMIGAVVGSQPIGGEGLSGTGPKAGGPHYLYRFCAERAVSVDTTRAGGNATLLSLDEGGI